MYCNAAVIRETNGNGFLSKVEALDTSGAYHTVWASVDPTLPGLPTDFLVMWEQATYPTAGLRLTVDTNHNMSAYEEIDAVQLIGPLVTYPTPAIAKVAPNPILKGGPDTTLVITGTGFAPNSVVRWNGAGRVTTAVSPTTLLAVVPAADTANAGTANVTVFTPAPGGGVSGASAVAIGPARYGDVDGDGVAALADVKTALRIGAGLDKAASSQGGDVAPPYPASAIGYGDGRIDILDAVRILRFLKEL